MTPQYALILYTSYKHGGVGGIQVVYLFVVGSRGYKVLYLIKIERSALFRESIAGNTAERKRLF
jgi:hypothetical protein